MRPADRHLTEHALHRHGWVIAGCALIVSLVVALAVSRVTGAALAVGAGVCMASMVIMAILMLRLIPWNNEESTRH
jgi:uncharacterized membrane protein